MTYLINLKKLGVNSTLLATSVALVACGGGGGGGYYGNSGSNNTNEGGSNSGNNSSNDSSKVAESIKVLDLKDASDKTIVNANDNSVVKFSVQVLNKDQGGIADKDVRLSITDNEKLGVTSKVSLVKTVDGGVAGFELNIPAIATASGKVLLTATVDGTSIKQVYTLNITKTSTVQSNYNLNVQQGVVLNLPKGTATINAQVTDQNGGIKAGQNVSLVLPTEMQGKFFISSGSSLTTDNNGNAAFTITANTDLTSDDIQKFVATSQSLEFKLVDEFKAQKTVKAAITFKDISQVVQKLEIIKADAPITAQNGTTIVKVRAKNSSDVALANKKVKLIFTDKSDAYGVSLDQAEVVTDANGYATFTIKANSSYPIALSQQGINLKAIYSDSSDVFAQDTITVITTDSNAADQLALQRLEIASSYKINAKNDQVTITVKGINNKGEAATKGKVTLALNGDAISNGVTFDGSAENDFSKVAGGYVTYTLRTNAKTEAAVAALVKSGITATFKTDNNLTNSIQIAVADEEKSEEAVGYLAIDPINSAFDYTKDQTITVKVKAIGVKGSALKGENISVALPTLTSTDLQALGLSLTGQASKNTDETGYATFVYEFKANGSDRQKQLVANGIRITAQAASNASQQTTTVNFKAPTDQTEIDLDYLAVDMPGNVVLTSGVEQTINVVVNATGTDGKPLTGQKIGIGLNEAALGNGVSLATASALSTENGKVTFSLKVKANSQTELTNLIANGITVAVKGARKDGSAYTLTRKIDVSRPPVILPNLAGLALSYNVQTVSVLGGDVRVKVIAQDSAGNVVPNTPLAIALAGLTGSRVSLSDSALTTNSKGEAEFTVKVSEGAYDSSLIKNGITFAIVGTNLNNGDRIQQTGTIQVAIPKDSVNLRLTSDKTDLEIGQSYQVQVAVKDELGANTAYPVNLSLNQEALNAGVKLSADSALTTANGSTAISLSIPKDMSDTAKQALLTSGIQVIGTIKNPKGEELKTTLSFTVVAPINTNHLTIDSNKISLSTAGDTALATVKLLDVNQGGVANQSVTLSIVDPRNATSIKGASQVVTNQYGEAVFSLDMKQSNSTNTDPILLIASHINEQGAVVQQVSQISVNSPTTLAPQLDLKLKASKDKLHVRGDAVDVSVLVTDINGSSQSGKAVTLTIPDYQKNGAYIRGASTVESDENGWVKFTVVIDENLRAQGYSAAQFITDDLRVEALVKDSNGTERRQSYVADIIAADVPVTQGSITVVMNPNKVGTDDTSGVYYNWNASVQVTDLDGRPVANQNVTMDVRAVEFSRGAWTVVENPTTKEKFWTQHLPPALTPPLACAISTTDDPSTPYDDRNVTITGEKDRNGVDVLETLNVVRFIGASDSNPYTATYTTDKEGKFDFQIRYPKAYASWLSVQIGATATLANTPIHGYRTVSLPTVSDDFDKTDWAFTPSINNKSPYGILNTCK
ncbi:hypothetical protein F889_03521 [Acinetobacter colistiniresistens]|uniref:Uncharacterized protein n=1 Tax=Acinetobacter colistiniresistens TaxID=280145 RepID=N9PG35_9GAMM|nr:hypothetical protein [Acinetobacter colistiniresistens]ENX32539.1 hypothetical protein F889_03521 [Acinetobacter colistiniresistens]